MKIVQVQTQAEAAGAQRVSDMVGAGLRARGHEVRTVFLYRKTDAYDGDPHADFVLAHRPRGAGDLLRAVTGLVGYMRRARPDAVISYQHYGNIAGTIAGRLAGARHLLANQSGAPGRHGGWPAALADRLLGLAGVYHYSIANSGWLAAQFDGYPAGYRRRLKRIDHGVAAAASALGRREARAAFDLPAGSCLMVSSGRLTRDKNHAALVGVLAALPDVHLALAGVGPEREPLLALAAAKGIGGRLHLVGELPRQQLADFLAAGDVYVFPSRTETFGLAAAEAAIAGLPVVANDLTVLREVLGEAAIYADAERPEALAAAVQQVRSDPALAAALSRAGRQLAERYSPERMCAEYEALLVRT
ncbi:MAG: glycosyl transferase family 1 [Devosia sp. 67-54]|uniref:glycosyltransferase family 4 protein n=1 Tax=unclassified Devosia TaxID=196773 RepID=UPI00095ABEEA|nr:MULTISPECIES: glycosyltransferase family 4 protein [unclassified Devosia]MBN9306541.1 glycosyltransferase family 4 protein [Devosia sp.]OJX15829.1 MAG: glycosyl transferase family 1 [Devosia sp. 67-54]